MSIRRMLPIVLACFLVLPVFFGCANGTGDGPKLLLCNYKDAPVEIEGRSVSFRTRPYETRVYMFG